MSLKYEPASEPLHIYVEWWFSGGYRFALGREEEDLSSESLALLSSLLLSSLELSDSKVYEP